MKRAAKWAISIAVAILVLLVVVYVWRRMQTKSASGFHGWRMQHYDDNPYAGQTYRCGRCNAGYHCPGQREGCPSDCSPAVTGPVCPPGCKLRHRHYFGPTGHVESFCNCAEAGLPGHLPGHLEGTERELQARTQTYCPQCYTCTGAGVSECVPGHAHVEACDSQGRANARDRCALREGFDGENWPQTGTFGATADTYPYGNYADGLQMFYPTFYDQQYNHYWSRF